MTSKWKTESSSSEDYSSSKDTDQEQMGIDDQFFQDLQKIQQKDQQYIDSHKKERKVKQDKYAHLKQNKQTQTKTVKPKFKYPDMNEKVQNKDEILKKIVQQIQSHSKQLEQTKFTQKDFDKLTEEDNQENENDKFEMKQHGKW